MRIPEEATYGMDRHQTHGSTDSRICGNPMVTRVSPEQYRKFNEFSLFEKRRHGATFGNAPIMTTNNGKGSMGEPSFRDAKQTERV